MPPEKLLHKLGQDRLTYIDRLSRLDVITRKLRYELFAQKASSSVAVNPRIYPFQDGIGIIPQKMAEQCQQQGISINFDCKIIGIENTVNGISIQYENNSKMVKESFEKSICTLPITEIPLQNADLQEFQKQLEFVDMTLVFFTLNCAKVKHNYYILYSYEEHHRWKRLRARSLPNGQTELLVEVVHSKQNPPNPDQLLQEIEKQLTHELALFESDIIVQRATTYIADAYPIHTIGYENILHKIRSQIENDSFRLAGRQAEFYYCNSEAAIQSGRKAGKIEHSNISF